MTSETDKAEGLSLRKRIALWLAVAVVYAGLAVASTWPVAIDLSNAIPQGTDPDVTVPLASVWALWWTSDRLAHGLSGYWDAPIFHPVEGAFAFSEPMPLLGVLSAPLFWLDLRPLVILNLVLLAALVSGGLVAAGLLRSLRVPWVASVVGGGCVVVLPYTHHELGVLTLVPTAGILGVLWGVFHFVKEPSPGRGALLGLTLVLSYLVCGQHTVFLVIACLPASVWWIEKSWLARRALGGVLVAVLVAGACLAPIGLSQRAALEQHDFVRSAKRASRGAATFKSWRKVPWVQAIPTPFVEQAGKGRALYPGTVMLVLALLGVVLGLRRDALRRSVGFLLTMGVVAWLCSMLPHVSIGGVAPYEGLRALVPGLTRLRSLWRFAVVVHVGVALLAAVGLGLLIPLWWRDWEGEARAKVLNGCGRIGVVTLMVLAVFEVWPTEQRFGRATPAKHRQALVDWIDANVGADEPLAFAPVPVSNKADDYIKETQRMFLQIEHGRPMLGGYSSYFPKAYAQRKNALTGFPSAKAHQYLRAHDVRYIVVETAWIYSGGRHKRLDDTLWEHTFSKRSAGVEIFRALDVER